MIGQNKLLSYIDKIIDNYSRFSIIEGPKGSGKHLIVEYICNKLNVDIIPVGCKVDDIRNTIDMSYHLQNPVCYVIYNADDMGIVAKNSLLKITEEPPNNAYFIMTLQSINNTLSTLKSRGTLLSLDTYTSDELIEYRKYKKYSDSFDDIVKSICATTGEVDNLFMCDIPTFIKHAQSIVTNLHLAISGNVFKLSKSIKQNADDITGFDGVLLLKVVRSFYIEEGKKQHKPQYYHAAQVAGKYIADLLNPTLNKLGTMDMWIMDTRKALQGL